MSASRTAFVSSLTAFKSALLVNELIDQALTEIAHNNRARILRNGLAVAIFATLEAFFKDRIAEVLVNIGVGATPFARLPEGLREICVLGAIRGLSVQSDLLTRNGEDPTPVLLDNARKLASVSTQPFDLSHYGFGYSKSNLNHADIKDFLKAFQVNDGWAQISALAARLGVASPAIQDSFRSATTRRHLAAHRSSAATTLVDLQSFAKEAIAIAIAVDALLSVCSQRIVLGNAAYLNGGNVGASDIRIRFVDQSAGRWSERRETATRPRASGGDLLTVRNAATLRARAAGEILVIRDLGKAPIDWDL